MLKKNIGLATRVDIITGQVIWIAEKSMRNTKTANGKHTSICTYIYSIHIYSISFYIKVAQIPKSGSLWPCQKSMPEGSCMSCAIYVHPGVNQCWSKLKSISRRAMMSSWMAESHEQLHHGSHGPLILLDKNHVL